MMPGDAALWALVVGPAGAMLWPAILVVVRMGALAAFAPGFGEQAVPARVKLGLALALAAVILPAVVPVAGPAPADPADAARMIAAEVLAGLFFGLVLRLFVLALHTAGAIVAQSTSVAQVFAGGAAEPAAAAGHLIVAAGLALAAAAGLHVQVAAYGLASYDLVPAGTFPDPAAMRAAGTGMVAATFGLAAAIAAPVVIAAFLYNLLMGVINRALPQLMVTLVGAPALALGGLALLALALPPALAAWAGALGRELAFPLGTLP